MNLIHLFLLVAVIAGLIDKSSSKIKVGSSLGKILSGGRHSKPSGGGGFGGFGGAGGYGATSSIGKTRASGGLGGIGRSLTSGTAGKVLVGAAAGYFAAKVGKKIAKGTARLFWPQYGRNYWMGNRYYQPTSFNMLTCRYRIIEQREHEFFYDDGKRVQEVIFECDRHRERCCGMTCCPLHNFGDQYANGYGVNNYGSMGQQQPPMAQQGMPVWSK